MGGILFKAKEALRLMKIALILLLELIKYNAILNVKIHGPNGKSAIQISPAMMKICLQQNFIMV